MTPVSKSLKTKFEKFYPDVEWRWEERSPSVQALFHAAEQKASAKKVTYPPQAIELLYLRQTEAERELKQKD